MTEVRLDVAFAHPPDRVWRAVTDRRLLGEWFMPVVADPEDASGFQLHPRRLDGFCGPLNGEVIEWEPPSRVVMRWHAEDLHVRVIIMIGPILGGCRLTFVQRGFLGPKGTLRRRVLRTTYQRLLTESLPAALDRLAGNDTPGTARGSNLAPVLRRTPAGGGKARPNDGGFVARRASNASTARVPETATAKDIAASRRTVRRRRCFGQLERSMSPTPAVRADGLPESRPAEVRDSGARLRGVRSWNAEQGSRAVVATGIVLLLVALILLVVAWFGGRGGHAPPQPSNQRQSRGAMPAPAAGASAVHGRGNEGAPG